VFNDTYSQAFQVFTEARVKEKKNLYGFGLYLGLCNVSPNNISDGNWELSGRSHWSNIFLFSQNQKKLGIPARVLILHEIYEDLVIENHRSWTFYVDCRTDQQNKYKALIYEPFTHLTSKDLPVELRCFQGTKLCGPWPNRRKA